MNMQNFHVIKIADKAVYLGFDDSGKCKWFRGKKGLNQMACFFNTKDDAERFGQNYFKKFSNWETKEVKMNTNDMVARLV